jgi:MFS family permease
MAFRTTWRWMFWATSIFQAVMILVSFTAFHETYAPTILARRAAKLRKESGDTRYYTEHERTMASRSVFSVLLQALSRPLRLLMSHPIIQINAVMSAFDYGILYIVLASFADLWVKQYGLSVELSGLHYLAVAFGEIAGSQLGAPIIDSYYRRIKARHPEADPEPEHRIPLTIPGLFIAPIGLMIYGWTAQFRVHWIVVDIGIVIATFGAQVRGIPTSAYIMDAYPEHTSSALAAQQVLRSLGAFLFPLFTPIMYEKIGYGWGNTAMASAELVLVLPGSLVLWYFGATLRRRMLSTA